jgi:uncharacterized protein YndB with AHSA1/START domain
MDAILTDQPSFEETYLMPVPAEDVWTALTRPESISRWHLCNVLALDLQPGGQFQLGSNGEGVIEGEGIACEPLQRLSHTFRFTNQPNDPTTEVTFTLEALKQGSRLTIAHTGFPGINRTYRDICACWPILMCGLQDTLRPARRQRNFRAA